MILLAKSFWLHCASLRATAPGSSLVHPLNPFPKSVDSSHPLTNSPTVSALCYKFAVVPLFAPKVNLLEHYNFKHNRKRNHPTASATIPAATAHALDARRV